MNNAIVVSNLGKAFKQYHTKWARLREWFSPGDHCYHTIHWVLRDLCFSVPVGQSLGIIGVNGAGKSTLLKMLTGITEPTTGEIKINGRVSAILELGMGFHPEFTGRQNVYMSGQLLGLSADELRVLMPKIESFASIGEYIDQPIRVYSSGMQVRLAFSVATAIRPDVLIIDEAFSVGDVEFQHRSFNLIREYQKLGTTILLVSHDKEMIMSICDQAILLHQGRIEIQGDPETVGNYYNAMLANKSPQNVRILTDLDGITKVQSGSGEVCLDEISLRNENDVSADLVKVGEVVSLKLSIRCLEKVADLVVGYIIKDRLGRDVFGTNTFLCNQQLHDLHEGEKVEYQFKFPMNLGLGNYSISIALHADSTHLAKNYLWLDRALLFTVVDSNKDGFVGVAWIPPQVTILR